MSQLMEVTVPDGLSGGMTMQIQGPSGPMQVQIPSGLQSGQKFQMQMPSMPPGARQAYPARPPTLNRNTL